MCVSRFHLVMSHENHGTNLYGDELCIVRSRLLQWLSWIDWSCTQDLILVIEVRYLSTLQLLYLFVSICKSMGLCLVPSTYKWSQCPRVSQVHKRWYPTWSDLQCAEALLGKKRSTLICQDPVGRTWRTWNFEKTPSRWAPTNYKWSYNLF